MENKLDNPAVAQHTALHPMILEAIREDPSQLAKISRVMIALIDDMAFEKVTSDPNTTVAQMLQVRDRLVQTADIKPKEVSAQPGGPYQLNINFSGRPESFNSVTVEQAPSLPSPTPVANSLSAALKDLDDA